MAAVVELDASLQGLRALKPPGITKSRVASIVNLCAENVKSESVLVQKIFTNFKKTPGTHKLGVLYVVDAVTRRWIELANDAGQSIAQGAASDGTYAAGVSRVTELLPHMMNDLTSHAPDDQKGKILKLIEIWERGQVFPAQILITSKKNFMARQPPTSQPTSSIHSQPSASVPNTESQISTPSKQPKERTNGRNPLVTQSEAEPPKTDSGLSAQENLDALASILPPGATSDPQVLSQYLQLLQHLLDMKVPPEQWPDVIAALNDQVHAAKTQQDTSESGPEIGVNTHGSGHDVMMSIRSTSTWNDDVSTPRRRSRSPPRLRGSPDYGPQGRQRSPNRKASPSLQEDKILLNATPKWTGYDRSLPDGHVKILSRTLFVSGITCNETELRAIFGKFAEVQSCTFDSKKRQAFLKIYTRAGAEKSKESMSDTENAELTQYVKMTRWGSGFGPREYSNHDTGESIIPITRISEADHKCALNAEYGGTGGRPLTTGLVMEEPDIDYNPPPKAARRNAGIESRRAGLPRSLLRRLDRDRDQISKGLTPVLPYADPPEHYDTGSVGTPPTVPSFGFQLSTLARDLGSGLPPVA